jgi:cytochrome P450
MTDAFLLSHTVQNPFDFYASIREESPVYGVDGHDAFLVTRFDDCVAVLGNPALFSSRTGPGLRRTPPDSAKAVMATGYRLVRTLLTNDPPDHRRYRSLVAPQFSARRISSLEPHIKALSESLVANCLSLASVDFVKDFAKPLPLIVIAEFLGVSDGDLTVFEKWSDDAAAVLGGNLSEAQEVESTQSLVNLLDYFAQQADKRRTEPRSDFLTKLQTVGKDPLTIEEIIALAYVVLVAGNETTVNLLSSAMLLLLQNPEQLRRVRDDRSLIPAVIEETLRLQAPIQGIPRVVTEDTEIRGVPISAGTQIVAMIAAGHRDPSVFESPDEFRLDRPPGRSHIAFGQGIHFCLGAALSRMEGSIALTSILDGFADIEISDPSFEPAYNDNAILRSLQSLPVKVSGF